MKFLSLLLLTIVCLPATSLSQVYIGDLTFDSLDDFFEPNRKYWSPQKREAYVFSYPKSDLWETHNNGSRLLKGGNYPTHELLGLRTKNGVNIDSVLKELTDSFDRQFTEHQHFETTSLGGDTLASNHWEFVRRGYDYHIEVRVFESTNNISITINRHRVNWRDYE